MSQSTGRLADSPPGSLEDAGVVVVGASAGIGRAVASRLAAAGARLVVAARRREALEELAEQTGATVAVADVCRSDDCQRLAETATDVLGQVDLAVSTVGYAPLQRLRDADEGQWHEILSANLVGANQLIRSLLPVMAAGGMITLLSSESVGNPRAGLGPYAAAKAGLEESLRAWRREEPQVRFCCAAVGATLPTEFGNHYHPDLLESMLVEWSRWGMIQQFSMDTEDLAAALVGALAGVLPYPAVGLETLVLRSPAPVITPTSDVAEIVTWAVTTSRTD